MLKVWYPLNGDLEDYSGNDNILTNNGALKDDNGKIGKCYTLTGTQEMITPIGRGWSSKSLSVSLWARVNTIESSKILIGSSNGNNQRIYIGVLGNKWTIGYGGVLWRDTLDAKIVDNNWVHLCYVAKNNKACLYVNGEKTQETIYDTPFNLASDFCIGHHNQTSYRIKASYNDVRIYDHALSLKEIKEISKVKILHYNFNQFAEPTVNLLSNTEFKDKTNWSLATNGTGKFTASNGWGKIEIPTGETGKYYYLYQNLNRTTNANTPITLSFEFKNNVIAKCGVRPVMFDGSSAPSQPTKIISLDGSGGTKRLSVTTKYSGISDRLRLDVLVGSYYSGMTDQSIEFSFAQLEEKGYATPYVDGNRVDRITDSSGFRNYSDPIALTTTPQWVIDSKLGAGCYKFNGNSKIYSTDTPISNVDMTMSAWVKPLQRQTINDRDIIVQTRAPARNYLTITPQGNLSCYSYCYNSSGYHNTVEILPLNEWSFITAIWSNTLLKMYINGVKVKEVSHTKNNAETLSMDLAIGHENSGRLFNGLIDDVRIYATALSDEDVKELYQSRGSVSKNGKIFVNEIKEKNMYDTYIKGVNLVRNGNGELKNSSNMGGTYITDDFAENGVGCFEYGGNNHIESSDFIKVNHNDIYKVEMYIKSLIEGNSYFAGVASYDKDKRLIGHWQVNRVETSKTTLAKPLNNGDTIVYLTSITGWNVGSQGVEHHSKQLGIFDRPEATNYERARLRSHYLNIDTVAKTITLKTAWSGGTLVSGTKVANVYDGGSYNYVLGSGSTPMEWTKKSTTITGWGTNAESKFRYGTEYIKILILASYGKPSNYKMRVSSISFSNISKVQHPDWIKSDVSVNKKGQLLTSQIIEIPSANLETKTAHGSDWVQVFYHNNKAGTVLFSNDKKEFLRCDTGDKKSNLYLLELFRGKDGKFEFLLEYESGGSAYNRWKQTSNFTSEPIAGYEAIQCSWTSNGWGGLEYHDNIFTWADGTVNSGNWYYSIGSRVEQGGGSPKWSGSEAGWVKLWVKCDNPNVFKIYKNGSCRATEFIEI